jgi:hypothetical protein
LGVSDYDLNNDHVRYIEVENNTIFQKCYIYEFCCGRLWILFVAVVYSKGRGDTIATSVFRLTLGRKRKND